MQKPINCYACDVTFTIEFEDVDAELNYCPHCGQESVDEITLISGDSKYAIIEDHDVDD